MIANLFQLESVKCTLIQIKIAKVIFQLPEYNLKSVQLFSTRIRFTFKIGKFGRCVYAYT